MSYELLHNETKIDRQCRMQQKYIKINKEIMKLYRLQPLESSYHSGPV